MARPSSWNGAYGRAQVEETNDGCSRQEGIGVALMTFVLTIDPCVSTSHSTVFSCTLHLIFMTRALQTFRVRNVFEICAHHTHMVAEL